MDQASNLIGSIPSLNGDATRSAWTPAEEDRLFRIVKSEGLSGRTTTEVWEKIADRLAAGGRLARRSASSVRHRAVKLGAYSKEPERKPGISDVAAVHHVAQASFAPVEIRNTLADLFESFAKTLRGA